MHGTTRMTATGSRTRPAPLLQSWESRPVYAESVGQPALAGNLADGIKWHDRAVGGDKEATSRAVKLFTTLHQANPGDIVALAYLGSATALLGRDAIDPNEQFTEAMRGLKLLDQAVGQAPDNVQVRMLRGYVCLNLPQAYFQRARCAADDFAHLTHLHESGQVTLPDGLYWEVLYSLGKAHKGAGHLAEAYETWKKLLTVSDDARFRALLKNEGMSGDPFAGRDERGARSSRRH